MTRRMQDKVSIITGSTSGLGAATAARFAAEGARVIVSGRNEERGETVVTSIREAGGEATFVRCNLDDEASIEVLVAAAVERYGRLDNVIANAAATAASIFCFSLSFAALSPSDEVTLKTYSSSSFSDANSVSLISPLAVVSLPSASTHSSC